MKNSYRIVTDEFSGYEVQIKYWWFPFVWFQASTLREPTNTHTSVELAEEWAIKHANGINVDVVKNLGKLP